MLAAIELEAEVEADRADRAIGSARRSRRCRAGPSMSNSVTRRRRCRRRRRTAAPKITPDRDAQLAVETGRRRCRQSGSPSALMVPARRPCRAQSRESSCRRRRRIARWPADPRPRRRTGDRVAVGVVGCTSSTRSGRPGRAALRAAKTRCGWPGRRRNPNPWQVALREADLCRRSRGPRSCRRR